MIWLAACSGAPKSAGTEDPAGTLSLQLTGVDSGGITYRLRNATFSIGSSYYDYDGGSSSSTSVSSETDLNAPVITTRLLPGSYNVTLVNGNWYLETMSSAGPARVDQAVLLSPSTQYAYIYNGGTYDISYAFGVDGELIDFRHGDLNIGITIEHPGESTGEGGGPSFDGGFQVEASLAD